MTSTARIVLKLDVEGQAEVDRAIASTQAKIAALEGTHAERLKKLTAEQDRATKAFKSAEKEYHANGKALYELTRSKAALSAAGGGLLKILKLQSIEFGVMTLALGALRLALLAGRVVMKAFHASLIGLGAAAGVAVAAISAVLGAMQQLQIAQMKPMFAGVYGGLGDQFTPQGASRSATGLTRNMMADTRFGMFSDKAMQQVMAARLQRGQQVGGSFRNELARLGDYTGGDEKALVALNEGMAEAQKRGKITSDVYAQLAKSSPVIKAAFEEMAGGARQADAAAASGRISYQQFHAALMDGNLKALKPYKGSLDEINKTIIGRFKGSVKAVKAELAGLSMTSAQEAYGVGTSKTILDAVAAPIDGLRQSLIASLTAIGPAIRGIAPNLFNGLDGMASHVTERFTFYIVKGMDWLDGFSVTINRWIGNVRNFFTRIGEYLVQTTQPFHELWVNFLKPLATTLLGSLSDEFRSFGSAVTSNIDDLKAWASTFPNIRKLLKTLYEAGNIVKVIIEPIIRSGLSLLSFFGKMTGVAPMLMTFIATFGLLTLAFKKGYSALAKWRGDMLTADKKLEQSTTKYAKAAAVVDTYTEAINRLTAAIRELNGAGSTGTRPTSGGVVPGAAGETPTTNPSANPSMASLGTRFPRVPSSITNKLLPYGSETWGAVPLGAPLPMEQSQPVGLWTRLRDYNAASAAESRAMWGLRYDKFKDSAKNIFSRPDNSAATQRAAYEAMSEEDRMALRQANAAKMEMGLTMGTMAAGGMIQQYGGSNAGVQGFGAALSGGGMGAMTMQMLGKSPVAGFALGSSLAAGQAIKSNTSATSNTGQALGSALQMAGVGAAIGSIVPGVGTAVGAAVGGTIGGVVGAIKGWRDADAARQKQLDAERAAIVEKGSGGGALNSVAAFGGRLRSVRKDRPNQRIIDFYGPEMQADVNTIQRLDKKSHLNKQEVAEYEKASANYTKWINGLTKSERNKADAYFDAMKQLGQRGTQLASEFSSGNFFGFKPQELAKYADRHHMDLSKTNLSIQALVKLSGYSMQAVDAMANWAVAAKRYYETTSEVLKTQTDRAQAGIDRRRVVAEFGRTAQADRDQGIKRSTEENVVSVNQALDAILKDQSGLLASGQYGSGPEAYQKFQAMISGQFSSLQQRGSERFTPEMQAVLNWQLASMPKIDNSVSSQMTYNPEFVKAIGTYGEAFVKDNSGLKGKALEDKLNTESQRIAGELKARFGITSSQDEIALNLKKKLAGSLEADGTSVSGKIKQAMIEATAQFTSYSLTLSGDGKSFEWKKGKAASAPGAGGTASTPADTTAALRSSGRASLDARVNRTTYSNPVADRIAMLQAAGFDYVPGSTTLMGRSNPDGTYSTEPVGDTSTSRFGRTLAAHAALTRMVPGRRMMTSGLRNYALGSMSSDHLTGRAYDLTGDNLGTYARNVNALGGFAEFHGAGGGRHLHVVPPVGDTAGPVGLGMGGTHNYSIVVNAADGASAGEIANEVMARIARKQRDAMERA